MHITQPFEESAGTYRIKASREELRMLCNTINNILEERVPNRGIGWFGRQGNYYALQIINADNNIDDHPEKEPLSNRPTSKPTIHNAYKPMVRIKQIINDQSLNLLETYQQIAEVVENTALSETDAPEGQAGEPQVYKLARQKESPRARYWSGETYGVPKQETTKIMVDLDEAERQRRKREREAALAEQAKQTGVLERIAEALESLADAHGSR